jgi:hypothetical protein
MDLWSTALAVRRRACMPRCSLLMAVHLSQVPKGLVRTVPMMRVPEWAVDLEAAAVREAAADDLSCHQQFCLGWSRVTAELGPQTTT